MQAFEPLFMKTNQFILVKCLSYLMYCYPVKYSHKHHPEVIILSSLMPYFVSSQRQSTRFLMVLSTLVNCTIISQIQTNTTPCDTVPINTPSCAVRAGEVVSCGSLLRRKSQPAPFSCAEVEPCSDPVARGQMSSPYPWVSRPYPTQVASYQHCGGHWL